MRDDWPELLATTVVLFCFLVLASWITSSFRRR